MCVFHSFGEKIWKAYDEWCEEVTSVLEKRIVRGENKWK